jgi:hypothetical protein
MVHVRFRLTISATDGRSPDTPTEAQLAKLAASTKKSIVESDQFTCILRDRLRNSHWITVLQALEVLEYCVLNGSYEIEIWIRTEIKLIETLKVFDSPYLDLGKAIKGNCFSIVGLLKHSPIILYPQCRARPPRSTN